MHDQNIYKVAFSINANNSVILNDDKCTWINYSTDKSEFSYGYETLRYLTKFQPNAVIVHSTLFVV